MRQDMETAAGALAIALAAAGAAFALGIAGHGVLQWLPLPVELALFVAWLSYRARPRP